MKHLILALSMIFALINCNIYSNNDALFNAAKTGDIGQINEILSGSTSINARSENGATALILAAAAGYGNAVITLLHHGASIDMKDSDGINALIGAAKASILHNTQIQKDNYKNIIKFLLSKGATYNKEALLSIFKPEEVNRWIEIIESVRKSLNSEQPQAEEKENSESALVKEISARLPKLESTELTNHFALDEFPSFAQMWAQAVDSGNKYFIIEETLKIIKENNDIRQKNIIIRLIERLITKQNFLESIQDNFTKDINDLKKDFIEEQKLNDRLLQKAAKEDNIELAKQALKDGANINVKNQFGNTPLILAAGKGNLNVAKFLLQNDANIDDKNMYGQTALMLAAGWGYLEIVNYLLEKKANINAKAKNGITALYTAAINGRANVIKVLLENGADVNAADENTGHTAFTSALLWAAKNGNIQAAKILYKNGANHESAKFKAFIDQNKAAKEAFEQIEFDYLYGE